MGRDVVADVKCIWQTAFPKIIAIAKEEGLENPNISNMITGLPMEMPIGKLLSLYVCYLYNTIPAYHNKFNCNTDFIMVDKFQFFSNR